MVHFVAEISEVQENEKHCTLTIGGVDPARIYAFFVEVIEVTGQFSCAKCF